MPERRAFDGWDLRRLDPALDHVAFAVNHVQFNQPRQELDVVHPFCGNQFAIFPQYGRQPQGFETMVQKDLRSVGQLPIARPFRPDPGTHARTNAPITPPPAPKHRGRPPKNGTASRING